MLHMPGSGHVVSPQSSDATFRRKKSLCLAGEALFPLGTRSLTETQRFCSTRSTRMSAWSKSRWVFSFNIVELNKHSVQSWLGLGLAPQCLSLWGRASPSQFSLLKMLMRALAPLHLLGNPVQTHPLPCNLQRGQIWTCFIKAKCQS